LSGTDATIDALHKLQEQVKNATSIVIGGAGPTGVETACELGAKYGTSKKITLVTAGKEVLLGAVPTKIARGAESVLTKRSVEIIKGVRIEDAKTADGTTTLTLDNGETIATDLYISTTGILPNSEFIPKTLLNEKGFVVVDEFLRVKGATDMWAVGDINHLEYPQLIYAGEYYPTKLSF
jgi:NADH dehydrogenase FAD-containing subunit